MPKTDKCLFLWNPLDCEFLSQTIIWTDRTKQLINLKCNKFQLSHFFIHWNSFPIKGRVGYTRSVSDPSTQKHNKGRTRLETVFFEFEFHRKPDPVHWHDVHMLAFWRLSANTLTTCQGKPQYKFVLVRLGVLTELLETGSTCTSPATGPRPNTTMKQPLEKRTSYSI